MPALLVSTMPSGSTRLTVAFLYSFPVTVLKSSACATEMNDRSKTVRSFLFTCLNRTLFLFSYLGLFGQGEFLAKRSVSSRQLPIAIKHANSSQAHAMMSFCAKRRISD